MPLTSSFLNCLPILICETFGKYFLCLVSLIGLVIGTNIEAEGRDRANTLLPPNQYQLIEDAVKYGQFFMHEFLHKIFQIVNASRWRNGSNVHFAVGEVAVQLQVWSVLRIDNMTSTVPCPALDVKRKCEGLCAV